MASPGAVEIRLLGAGDAAVLERVADGVFDGPVVPRWTEEVLADRRHHLIVALVAGEVVGMISAVDYVHPDKAPQLWINEVGVAPAHQRRGIARRLLDAMLERGRALGCTEAWVGTEEDNTAARGLYESAGSGAELFVLYAWRLVLLLCLVAAAPLHAQEHRDAALQGTLDRLAEGFHGEVGVYVRHLGTGAAAEIRADELFPTASLIKVPLLLTLYETAERGALDLEAAVPFPDTLRYPWAERTDVVAYLAPGDTLPLRELAFLMMSVSDNLASLWIQALVGGGEEVNRWLAAHGYPRTRVNSRTPGREAARAEYGWGQTTPREMAELLVMIREGRAVTPAASEEMYRMLTSSYWRAEALSRLPPTVQAASKQGFVDESRSEVLLVNARSGDYVLAVITKNQADISHDRDNEGLRLIRAISRATYEHFNPDDPWRPRD